MYPSPAQDAQGHASHEWEYIFFDNDEEERRHGVGLDAKGM